MRERVDAMAVDARADGADQSVDDGHVGAAAPGLTVENAMKISPELFPGFEPVRARPIVARRAMRFADASATRRRWLRQ